jgi:hypothetical protein
MKIRIKDNSIRFRLTQSEVAKLGEDGYFKLTEFVDRPFIYAIEKQKTQNFQPLSSRTEWF